ncbi:MAG: Gfo/Idh/MocA family oxidoreductase, partial [Elusimicrobia bacterium]|nr:Gfo/Idh/MocA family oxidoreductase [Elusimicrobiota bacterium]
MRLRVAVIGAGRIGRVHAWNLARLIPDAELAAVADVRPEAARAVAKDCGAAACDPPRVLADPTIAAVAVCSSTDTHAALVEADARARHGGELGVGDEA